MTDAKTVSIDQEIEQVFTDLFGDAENLEVSAILLAKSTPHFCVWCCYDESYDPDHSYIAVYEAGYIDVYRHVAARCVLDGEAHTLID